MPFWTKHERPSSLGGFVDKLPNAPRHPTTGAPLPIPAPAPSAYYSPARSRRRTRLTMRLLRRIAGLR